MSETSELIKRLRKQFSNLPPSYTYCDTDVSLLRDAAAALESSERKCGEKDEVIRLYWHLEQTNAGRNPHIPTTQKYVLFEKAKLALSSDCGKDWVRKEDLGAANKRIVELESVLKDVVHGPESAWNRWLDRRNAALMKLS